MNNKQLHIMKLTDELLNIIDNVDDITRSDLQGILEARVATNCCDIFKY